MLKVLKSGFYTTIQDLGRFNYRTMGVPVSGAMDNYTVSKLNMILENEEDAAVLEITMTGPTVLFDEPTHIALGGAEMSATLNNEPIDNHKIYKIQDGDILSYGRLEKGFRAYLAVKDGFSTEKVLGSRSMFFPITNKRHIADGAVVPYEVNKAFEPKISKYKVDSLLGTTSLEVYRGPEFNLLHDRQLEQLFGTDFSVAKENNRMAYQINERLSEHQFSMLTSATLSGTVQLTPLGKLIILMKDGQTTGGYPRILQLSKKAIAILSQKKSKDKITFKLL